jgi:preprotein translocase subunit SecA
MGFFNKLFGTKSDKDIKAVKPVLNKVIAAYQNIDKLSPDQLRAKTKEFKEAIQIYVQSEKEEILRLKEEANNDQLDFSEKDKLWKRVDELEEIIYKKTEEKLNDILPEAFAVMKATAKWFKENSQIEVTATDFDRDLATRFQHITIEGDKAIYQTEWEAGGNLIKWDMVHYDVQLIGGIVLHRGEIAEMATGEGKTLVATLPVYLNALSGMGVHVVTVNDYLAKRDAEWMGVLFEFHGLSVDCIDKHQPNSEARKNAYKCDITYGTNNEFGFDYLRDNMTQFPDEIVQRKHNYAIVDEVDSVLIDDARTPLIISGPTPRGEEQEYDEYKPYVEKLYNEQRKLVNAILVEAKKVLSSGNDDKTQKKGGELLLRAFKGLPKYTPLIKFLSQEGMKLLMQKTENFYLQEQAKHMHIITDELFFIIDEKNHSVELTDKGMDYINSLVDIPNFYAIPDVGTSLAELSKEDLPESEMAEKKSNILRDFSLQTERVHTVNQLLKAYTLFEIDVEYIIQDNKIKIVDEQTGRVMEGRRYSEGLHQAIEAKENVKVEAATQTYATVTLQNYFRMYSKLSGMTGTAETEAGELWDIYKLDVVVIPTNKPIIRDDREDKIYRTKREKYNAIIEEIQGLIEEKRPVLVGTTSVETSELLSKMLTRLKINHNVLNAKMHTREAQIVKEAGQAGVVTIATNMAGRGTDIKLGEGVKEAGGLAIIGTERHDSRRVDRQLRGRAGRQGDPGSSQFFVSLEDNLMRMFGSDRIAKIMDRLGLEEGEVIQHSMITKSIERAQKKVEENNFGIRKRLLEYDDVMNKQREAIYKKRRNALYGDRLSMDIASILFDTVEKIVIDFKDIRDYEGFTRELLQTFAIQANFDENEFLNTKEEVITEQLFEKIYKNYQEKNTRIKENVLPTIVNVAKTEHQYANIAIPITDGHKEIQTIANIEQAVKDNGQEVIRALEKGIALKHIDNAWKEHLREMDDLKQSVQTASYEQKDPLLIYKLESFGLFKAMVEKTNKEIGSFLVKAQLPVQQAELQEVKMPKRTDMSKMKESREDLLSQAHSDTQKKEKAQPIVREYPKVGRNDPCPCGSGKKYKHCHGKNQ